jgi:hypothetical protein
MPKFLVKKDTCVSHLGRLFKEGDIADFEVPVSKVPRKDPTTGKHVVDADGALAFDLVPMAISSNLELIKPEADPKKK